MLAISFAIGFGFHSIEGVSDPEVFWVGNLSWPYLLIPALTCLGIASPPKAIARSVGSGVLMVLGFYNALGLLTVTALEMGLAPETGRGTVFVAAVKSYLQFLVLGRPGGIPWITVAVVTGVAVALGHQLAVRRSQPRLFWGAVAAVGLLEPVLHFAPFLGWLPFGGYRLDGQGVAIAAAEWLLAIGALGWLAARRPARPTAVTA